MASRKEILPSAPLVASNAAIEVVAPSTTSLVVATYTVLLAGLRGTATIAQAFETPSVQDIGTVLAPASVLLAPMASLEPVPELRFHCCNWLPPTVRVRASPVVPMMSKTSSPVALETFTEALAPLPPTEAKVPKGDV